MPFASECRIQFANDKEKGRISLNYRVPSKTQKAENVSLETTAIATAPAPIQAFEKCPKCELRPATAGRNRWCSECNSEYLRDYQEKRLTIERNKGFREGFRTGALAMKASLLAGLAGAHDNGALLVHQVRDSISSAPLPEVVKACAATARP